MATVYKMVKQNAGSEKFGMCECCKKSVDTFYTLHSETLKTTGSGLSVFIPNIDLFGHKECLSSMTFDSSL